MKQGDEPPKRIEEEYEGRVEELLPNNQFAVRLSDRRLIRAMVSRGSRAFIVKLVPGDAVVVTLFPYDPTRGSITHKRESMIGGVIAARRPPS